MSLMLALVGAAILSSTSSPLTLHNCNFGETYAFATAECTAHIDNNSEQRLELRIAPAPRKDDVQDQVVVIPPKGRASVSLRAPVGNRVGRVLNYFSVHQEGSDAAPVYLEAHGFAMTALDDIWPSVDFGSVEATSGTTREISLSSRETSGFGIERVLQSPPQLDVRIGPDGRTLHLTLRKDASWGVLSGLIKLAIDSPRQKEAWVAVRGQVHGDVAPDGNPVSLGLLEVGREHLMQLTTLRSATGKPFELGELRVEGLKGGVVTADCIPPAVGCKVLRVNISSAQPEGMVRGKVLVEFPKQRKTLPIDFQGFFRGNDLTLPVSDSEKAASGDAEAVIDTTTASGSTVTVNTPVAAKNAGPVPPEPPPPGEGPLLKWSIADERSVYGYQVFRADREEGPFVLLNVPAIAAKSNSKAGSSYQWRDNSTVKGKTYWYYVGVVYNDGRKEKITPDSKTIAK